MAALCVASTRRRGIDLALHGRIERPLAWARRGVRSPGAPLPPAVARLLPPSPVRTRRRSRRRRSPQPGARSATRRCTRQWPDRFRAVARRRCTRQPRNSRSHATWTANDAETSRTAASVNGVVSSTPSAVSENSVSACSTRFTTSSGTGRRSRCRGHGFGGRRNRIRGVRRLRGAGGIQLRSRGGQFVVRGDELVARVDRSIGTAPASARDCWRSPAPVRTSPTVMA